MSGELPTWVKVQAVSTHPLYDLLVVAFKGDLVNIANWAKDCGYSPVEMIDTIQGMVRDGKVTAEFFIEREQP